METTMKRRALTILGLTSFVLIQICSGSSLPESSYDNQPQKLQQTKASHHHKSHSQPTNSVPPPDLDTRVFRVTAYGADPTGQRDSTQAFLEAIADSFRAPPNGFSAEKFVNLGGARLDLEGGTYVISHPVQFPTSGRSNYMMHGGTLRATNDFDLENFLIDLSISSTNDERYNYDFITIRDLVLDSNSRGGGIQVANSRRTFIENCYISHFSSTGISVQGGQRTFIRNTYVDQHMPVVEYTRRNITGSGITLKSSEQFHVESVITVRS